ALPICLGCGMDAYVSKPIRSDELFATIDTLVNGAGESPGEAAEGRPMSLKELIDWDQALGYVGGDADLLRDLVKSFVAECPKWLRSLDAALAAGDAAAVHAAVHPFKNSLQLVGARA